MESRSQRSGKAIFMIRYGEAGGKCFICPERPVSRSCTCFVSFAFLAFLENFVRPQTPRVQKIELFQYLLLLVLNFCLANPYFPACVGAHVFKSMKGKNFLERTIEYQNNAEGITGKKLKIVHCFLLLNCQCIRSVWYQCISFKVLFELIKKL